jgi:tRNA threonylcarbamoyladenosine biosynthesis protein TsaE
MKSRKQLGAWTSQQAEDLTAISKEIWGLLPNPAFVAIEGEMGAGKTTTVAALIQAADITHFEGSPTFAIVQSYHSPIRGNIYHLDCYRIEDQEELINLGLEELIEENATFFIEWPEKINEILPLQHYWLYIRMNPDMSRTLALYHDY